MEGKEQSSKVKKNRWSHSLCYISWITFKRWHVSGMGGWPSKTGWHAIAATPPACCHGAKHRHRGQCANSRGLSLHGLATISSAIGFDYLAIK